MADFDLEEIFADMTQHPRRRATPGHLETPIREISVRIFLIGSLLLFSFFGIRTYSLTIRQGANLADAALEARERLFLVSPNRGAILDRNGLVLVANEPGFVLLYDPLAARSGDAAVLDVEVRRAAQIAEVEVAEIFSAITRHGNRADQLVLLDDIPQSVAVALSATIRGDALRVEASARRLYVDDDAALSTVLGYVGAIDAEEAENYPTYDANDAVGKSGVEKYYETVLRGEPGERRVTVSASGERQDEEERDAKNGNSIRLTIDAALTRAIADALDAGIRSSKASGGAVVAIDPRDGALRSLVSLPTFTAESLSNGISREDYAELIERLENPFLNRAVSGTYPIGSTIKPFIASAGLQERVITPWQKIDASAGEITVTSVFDPDVSWTFPDWKPHGIINVFEAIARSSNVFFYIVGGGFEGQEGLGIERVSEALIRFGFGTPLGIDLPGESSGRVPTPKWKRETLNEEWYIGDTYNASIGQGNFIATPLQLATATAAVANGGTLWRPHVLDAVLDAGGNVVEEFLPVPIRNVAISAENLAFVREGMRRAVTASYGTNRALANLPMTTAAKTGTAQFGDKSKTHALVTAFTPYEDPELVLAIVLEGGGSGTVATAVARDILQWYATTED